MEKTPYDRSSLAFLAGWFLAVSAAPAQTIINPNFDPPAENTADNTGSGFGLISDWSRSGTTSGVNSSSQTYMNGQTAHSGTYAAFIHGSGNISQSISGFDPAKLYSVTYFVSERGSTGTATSTSVSLNNGSTYHVQTENIVRADKFRRIVSAPLTVSGASSTLQINATGVAGDNALLIDTVSIARAAPIIADGGFENPVQPTSSQTTRYKLGDGSGGGTLVGSAWNFETSPSGIVRNGSAFNPYADIYTAEGSQSVVLWSSSQISTTVNGFEAGVTYSLSFQARGRTESSLGPNVVSVKVGSTTLAFGGETSITPGGVWTTYTTDGFTTPGGSLTLTFQGLTGGDKSTFIDDVRLNFLADAATTTNPIVLANLAATDIQISSATLNGVITMPEAAAEVYAYWGTTDGGSNPAAWAHSALVGSYTNVVATDLSIAATGLDLMTTYYYAFRAVNDTHDVWAQPGAVFITTVPAIRSVVMLGTSITNLQTDSLDGGAGYLSTRSCGMLPVAQAVLSHAFSMAPRTNGYDYASGSPDLDHGYTGYTAVSLLTGHSSYPDVIPINDAIATGADAIIIEAGANDTAQTAAVMAARIVAIWDAAIPHFKKVFVVNILPWTAAAGANPDPTMRDKIIAANLLLVTAAALRPKVVLFNAYSVIPKDGSNYGAAAYFDTMGIHPNATGGILLGKALAEVLRPYVRGVAYSLPAADSTRWLTPNRLTTGSATLPEGWTLSTGTSATYTVVDETGIGGYEWQRLSATAYGSPASGSLSFTLSNQQEVVVANAANANAGTAVVTIRHGLLPGGEKTFNVPVAAGDATDVWMGKIGDVLAADSEITSVFALIYFSDLLSLSVNAPDRTDHLFSPEVWTAETAGIQIALPGVGASVGWERGSNSDLSLGGFKVGDNIRACAYLRNHAACTNLEINATINAGGFKSSHALGPSYMASGTIETVDGLYLTYPITIPANCTSVTISIVARAASACSFDARGAGLFIESYALPQSASYTTWAATHAPSGSAKDDYDGDGVSNGVEYVLGGTKTTTDLSKLPELSISGGNVLFTFKRAQASIDGTATVTIEVGSDLATWPSAYAVPDGAATNIPGVSVVKNTSSGFDTVTLTLPQAPNPGKFARLKVVAP